MKIEFFSTYKHNSDLSLHLLIKRLKFEILLLIFAKFGQITAFIKE